MAMGEFIWGKYMYTKMFMGTFKAVSIIDNRKCSLVGNTNKT